MKEQHSRRGFLSKTTVGLGLTLSPSIVSGGVGAIERTSSPNVGLSSSAPQPLPAVRNSVLYLQYPDAPAVAAPTDRQFVFLDVTSNGLGVEDVPSATDFALRVRNELFRAGQTVDGVPLEGVLMWANDLQRIPYTAYERWRKSGPEGEPGEVKSRVVGEGVLMFSVPTTINATDITAELHSPDAKERLATWTFDSEFIDTIRNPPTFEVTSFEIPNRIERGKKEPISLSVSNKNGRSDTFSAVFGIDSAAHPNGIEFSVPAGEQATWDGFIQYPPTFEQVDEAADHVEYVLDLGHTKLRRSIDIVD